MADRTPSRSGSGFAAGAVAALLTAVVMLVAGPLAGVPIPLQLVADRLTALVPLDLFGAALGSLESSAKPLALVGVVIGQVIVGGGVGVLAARLARRSISPGTLHLGLTAATWAVLAFAVAPLG